MPIDPLTGLLSGIRKPGNPGVWGTAGTPTNNFRALSPGGTGYMTDAQTYPQQTLPGFTPDYQALIANDPLYKQMQLDTSAAGIGDAASRAAATQKALINFGLSPDFGAANNALGINQSWLQSDITPQAQAAATGNKLSIAQRIQDAYQQQLQQLRVSLRARGASRSGEAGYGQQQALNARDQGSYDATQQLLDYIAGVQSSFATGERTRQQQLAAAQQDAATRQAQLNPAQPDTVLPAQTVAPFYVGPVGSTSVKWAPKQRPGRNPANPLGL